VKQPVLTFGLPARPLKTIFLFGSILSGLSILNEEKLGPSVGGNALWEISVGFWCLAGIIVLKVRRDRGEVEI
jgi:hypothetical protein